jgi:predicted PurR-regulated permease PerM
MVGFMQSESFWMALLVSGIALAIATFVGIFLITWITGKISKMNPVAVFISVLFWGWLWGIGGLLLAIPTIGIVMVVSQHIKELQPVDELLRE